MTYYKCRVRHRRGAAAIEIVADFILPVDSETNAFRLLKAAYPNALEYHALPIVLVDEPLPHPQGAAV